MYLSRNIDKSFNLPTGSSFGMIFNGIDLETTFGVRTLEVKGRHFIEHDVVYTASPYMDGGRLMTNRVEPRYLSIQLFIKHDEEDVMDILNNLSGYLSKFRNPVPIKFRDELDYTYYGVFKNADFDLDNVRGIRIVTLEFICPDPYVYKTPKTYKGTTIVIDENYALQPSPFRIKLINPSLATVLIFNTTQNKTINLINLQGTKTYEIFNDYRDPYLNENGILAMNKLNINSNWGDFTISPGDKIVCSVSMELEFLGVRI